jgi:predicted Zn-dependent protease
MSAPYTFDEATAKAGALATAQEEAEQVTRDAYKQYAFAERAYRQALAVRITTLRSEGTAATLTADLARGDRLVADLRYKRDVAEGVVEAAKQSGWRLQANRRDMQEFVRWSHHRDLAENGGGQPQPQWMGAM